MAGDDRGDVVVFDEGRFGGVEPQLSLPGFFIKAMALEAVFGKNWADVAVELHLARGAGRGCRDGQQGEKHGEHGAPKGLRTRSEKLIRKMQRG